MRRVEFDSTKKSLDYLLKKAHDGFLQLPDFQRGWVWDEEGLKGLLTSISRSFPVGAIMTLQTGGEVRFKPRLVEGVPEKNASVAPEALILDGQQRITSLYQTTMRREVVETINSKKQRIKRFFYIDMTKALDESVDRAEAIIGVPENRKETRNFGREIVRNFSTAEQEYAQCMFPTNRIFDPDSWQMGFYNFWRHDAGPKMDFWFRFLNEILGAFRQYQMPVIQLGNKTSREAVCLVFEKVNTGGKKLDAFELLTAIYAGEENGFELRKKWADCAKRLLPCSERPSLDPAPADRILSGSCAAPYARSAQSNPCGQRSRRVASRFLYPRDCPFDSTGRLQETCGPTGGGLQEGWQLSVQPAYLLVQGRSLPVPDRAARGDAGRTGRQVGL
jgi:hypothetical protein